MRKLGWLRRIGLISAVGGACLGQSVPSAVVRSGQFVAGAPSAWFSVAPGAVMSPQATTAMPYSAEMVTEHAQTLADGTNITQTTVQSKIFRDSQGRTRNEDFLQIPGSTNDFPVFIRISDPVAGYLYTLDPRRHTVRRITLRPASGGATRVNAAFLGMAPGKMATDPSTTRLEGGRATVAAVPKESASGASQPETSSESLGARMIEGVQATGTRTTTIYPEGFFGNDRPLTTTSEIWNSPDLKAMVLMTNSDPRSGETTMRLTNIVQAEPDASLFEIPSDYQVIDQGATGGVISFDPAPAKQ